MKRKITATILTTIMAANLAITPAFAAANVTYNGNTTYIGDNNQGGVLTEPTKPSITFSDVKAGDWYYEPVMAMAEMGLIGGTTTPVNGVGTYSPDSSMTKAQFITILTRYLFSEDVKNYNGQYNAYWYSANYGVAVDKGLIKNTEFSEAAMDKPANRQEMAMMLVRSMEVLGMDTSAQTDKSAIPDYSSVGTYYRDYVRVAYQAGLIAGMDSAGTFAPKDTMNRAQAATVLNRLIDASTRVDIGDGGSGYADNNTGVTENVQATGTMIYDGRPQNLNAKAGDTFVKADGTKVVLTQKVFSDGVVAVGYGQGCNLYCGYISKTGIVVKDGILAPDGTPYRVSDLTGECYSSKVWASIAEYTKPSGKGDYNGQVKNVYWKWDANVWHPENGTGDWVGQFPSFAY